MMIVRAFKRQYANGLQRVRSLILPEWRLARDAQWQSQPELLQPYPVTAPNRHPHFFAVAARHLSDVPQPHILSFGCATGEEVFAIARYLPNACVTGIDINAAAIAKANRKIRKDQADRIAFICTGSPPEVTARYDAIFCLSVLRHARLDREMPENCETILPFSIFDRTVASLDAALKPGGLLFLWGANFQFSDCTVSAQYKPIAVPGKKAQGGVFYGPDNQRLPPRPYADFVFEKRDM
jgi:SAM-dependent methyltransferase